MTLKKPEGFQELCGWLTTPLLKADLGKMPQALLCGVHTVNNCLRMIGPRTGTVSQIQSHWEPVLQLEKKYCISSPRVTESRNGSKPKLWDDHYRKNRPEKEQYLFR